MQFEEQARLATKLYYYTTREQTSEATKKCADCVSPIFIKNIIVFSISALCLIVNQQQNIAFFAMFCCSKKVKRFWCKIKKLF